MWNLNSYIVSNHGELWKKRIMSHRGNAVSPFRGSEQRDLVKSEGLKTQFMRKEANYLFKPAMEKTSNEFGSCYATLISMAGKTVIEVNWKLLQWFRCEAIKCLSQDCGHGELAMWVFENQSVLWLMESKDRWLQADTSGYLVYSKLCISKEKKWLDSVFRK